MALANAAHASSPVVAKDVGCVVRSTVGFKVAEYRCVGIAFTVASGVRFVAVANATFQVAATVTLVGIADVTLIVIFKKMILQFKITLNMNLMLTGLPGRSQSHSQII